MSCTEPIIDCSTKSKIGPVQSTVSKQLPSWTKSSSGTLPSPVRQRLAPLTRREEEEERNSSPVKQQQVAFQLGTMLMGMPFASALVNEVLSCHAR